MLNPVFAENPFDVPLASEIIEAADLYKQLFSEQILIGETLDIFRRANVVVLGPQGCGKTMLLNLIRNTMLSRWMAMGALPERLRQVRPFFGISINLTRSGFSGFGIRAVADGSGNQEFSNNVFAAADFLNHYLLREFIRGLEVLRADEHGAFREWIGIKLDDVAYTALASGIATSDRWFGYYDGCKTLIELHSRCEQRLNTWLKFLNSSINRIPDGIWSTKTILGEPIHSMANTLEHVAGHRVPIFAVIDQYEELRGLTDIGGPLQRLINGLLQKRDPAVFYKIGARNYGWGSDLRIYGTESRIELQRDYKIVNLAEVLRRGENTEWIFPAFAADVARKRIQTTWKDHEIASVPIERIFGRNSPEEESTRYVKTPQRRRRLLKGVSEEVRAKILQACERHPPIDVRLASAWAYQRRKNRDSDNKIIRALESEPWKHIWWNKERKETALLQIASLANQRKLYYGWNTIVYLAGGNISAFLFLCGEIWDVASKTRTTKFPLDALIQTQGVYEASNQWWGKEQYEQSGGARRYAIISRLGPAINRFVVQDWAMSNPGFYGFSIEESELLAEDDEELVAVSEFVRNAVSWAFFEERRHKSKNKNDGPRRKLYLHPLLSPVFQIPMHRVKEPMYVKARQVYEWFFGSGPVLYGKQYEDVVAEASIPDNQLPLPL